MRFVFMGARILLGLMMVVFGLNYFLSFFPIPPMPEKAGAFMGALVASGYMMPWIKTIEVGCGLLFLFNRFAALAALVLAPISLNIFAFHLFLEPQGIPAGVVVVLLNAIIAFENRAKYSALLRAN